MHSKAKTYSEVTVLQVVGKSYDSVSGRLKGLSMSDGCIVSHNVVPNNHAAAEQMNEFKRFDLIQVKAARVKKDLLILDDVDLCEVTDKAGNPFQITRHILGQGVAELRQARESGPLGRPVPGRKSCAIQLQNNFGGSKRNNLGGRQGAWGGGGVVQVGARENEKKTPRLSLLCKKLHRA